MFCGSILKTRVLHFRVALGLNPDVNSRSGSHNYVGRYIRKILASLEDPVRKVSSIKKDDFSTPHPPKDPPDPYVPDNIVHQAFDPPRKIPKTVFRKFKSPDEVLGPNADKCKDYKNPEYFSYHRYAFVNLQRASLKLRKERIEDQQEAESDAEFDAQLEAEWEAVCEKEQEGKCPSHKPTELKCAEEKRLEEIDEELPENQQESEVCESLETYKIEDKQEKVVTAEDEECRKQREEECRKERQKQRDAEACREAEEQKIEEEKKKKREERKQIEAECKKKAEENMKALAARKAGEKKAADVNPKGEEAIKNEKAKLELELRKMVEKCKKEIIQKKRIEEKCKRVAEQRLREEKCRKEMERQREEIDAKNVAQNLKSEEEEEDEERCKLNAYKEECMKSAETDLQQQTGEKREHETTKFKSLDKKVNEKQAAKICESKENAEASKQSIEQLPPGVIYYPGAAVCDTKSEEEKPVSSDAKKHKDDN